MRKVAFYVAWGIRRILLGHRVPLNCTIILTDRCTLRDRGGDLPGAGAWVLQNGDPHQRTYAMAFKLD